VTNNIHIQKIIEIGSGSGNGSTQCFIRALAPNQTNNTKLICIEAVEEHYNDLVRLTKDIDFVEAHNKSSIGFNQLSTKEYSTYANSEYNSHLSEDEIKNREQWFNDDIDFFKNTKTGVVENLDGKYDLCLIDGSEFSGYDEFKAIEHNVRFILLDDDRVYKNIKTKNELLKNDNWTLIAEGAERNGWSSFAKIP